MNWYKKNGDNFLCLIFYVSFGKKKMALYDQANLRLLSDLDDLKANIWEPYNCMNGNMVVSVRNVLING